MIFLTVGTQLPFDRLIRTIDEWLEVNSGIEVVAQIGVSEYIPKNMKFFRYDSPDIISKYVSDSELIIGHAGVGTILTALQLSKPVAVMARKFSFGEHRNDHQVSTVHRFTSINGFYSFTSAQEMTKIYEVSRKAKSALMSSFANDQFLKNIENIIEETNVS